MIKIWHGRGLAPHRWRKFKRSNDKACAEKLDDVVGLYVSPPAHVIVLWVDEKSLIQALARTQRGLLLRRGCGVTITHDNRSSGTTTLFAVLNVFNGSVIGRNMQRHCYQAFIRFLIAIEAELLPDKAVQVILDNDATHMQPKVRAWLARHPRWTFHFVQTSCSWLNAVEGLFAKLTRRRLNNGVLSPGVGLQAAINRFIKAPNEQPKPFIWRADPDAIIAAVKQRVPNAGINPPASLIRN